MHIVHSASSVQSKLLFSLGFLLKYHFLKVVGLFVLEIKIGKNRNNFMLNTWEKKHDLGMK